MRKAVSLFAGLLFVLLLGAHAQEKVQLLYRAKAGQTMRYRINATISVEAAGQTFNLQITAVAVQKILEVTPEGNIKQEQYSESYEMTFNGNKMPTPEEATKDRTVTVIKPNGEPLSRETEREEQDESASHISQAMSVIFPSQPVGAGDTWSYTFKEDSKAGTLPGTAEYTLKGFEQWKGIRVARIASTYTAKDDTKLSATAELLVEVRTGDVVYASVQIEGMSFGAPGGGAPAKGQFEIERIEGSPLPEGEEISPAPAPKPEAKPKDQQPAEKQPAQPDKTEKSDQPGKSEKSDKPDQKKKEKTIDEVVKDFEKMEGLFTLYRKKEAGKDTLYMAIREEQLNRLYFLQATISEGVPTFFLAAGTPVNDLVFKFVRRDEQILLVVPNLRFYADPKKPIARSVQRSFADAYLEAFKIEAKDTEGKTFLIDVSNFFRSDVIQIQQLASAAAGGSYTIDREKTAYTAVKVFPNNIFVQTAYHFSGGPQRGGGLMGLIAGLTGGAELADPRSMPITVNYNLWELPTHNGYRPRLFDPRVGYFYTEYLDFTTDQPEQAKRYILRWQLEKADPNAPLSPPKEPIVFWLDNAIPEEYRDAIREGILEWNKAFEKIGIKDAIVVKQMPDDADWDHADMRYNVVRWVSSPNNGYAVALFRANPLTGQILNASITIDGNMSRITRLIYQRSIDPLTAFREAEAWEKGLVPFDPRVCTLGEGSMFRAWTGYLMMELLTAGRNATRVSEDQFVKDYLRSVVMHEMGHILGLRHNFVASRLHSLDDLAKGDLVRREGTVASVMEYDPFNQMALHAPNTFYWNPTIGPYDYWAIEYGYKEFGVNTPEAEKPFLQQIARRNTEPGLAFETDEYADRFDPYVTRFDLGRDPIAYWELVLKDTDALLRVLPNRVPRPGESYYEFTRYFFGTLANFSQAAVQLSRFIGGLQIRRNFRDDPKAQPPSQPIDGATQRRALNLLVKYIFSERAFDLPKSYFNKLAPDPYRGVGGPIPPDTPARDFISNIQRLTLARLFAPDTLRRIVNNEFKVSDTKNAFTLAELFRSLQDAIWSEAGTGKPVNALRRLLQRAHLQQMTDLLVKSSAAPDDAKMLARYHLRRLHAQLKQALPKVQDDYTRAHYSEAIDTIEKALNAQYMLGMPEFRMPNLLELLGLGRE
jgi:hypothetical protein